jgi:hypothetical protein
MVSSRTTAQSDEGCSCSIHQRPRGSLVMLLATAAVAAAALSAHSSVEAKLADRSRVVHQRKKAGKIKSLHDYGRPLEGPLYRAVQVEAIDDADVKERYADELRELNLQEEQQRKEKHFAQHRPQSDTDWMHHFPEDAAKSIPFHRERLEKMEMLELLHDADLDGASPNKDFTQMFTEIDEDPNSPEAFGRKLSSQLTGCCYNYKSYSSSSLCSAYGNNCNQSGGGSGGGGSRDGDCSQKGLSFIGISFSVNTASGNPYSYQLCDQFAMEGIIDRSYSYLMSMDEDGWLVGGGYKSFDYSGKMPYVLSCRRVCFAFFRYSHDQLPCLSGFA